MRNVNTLIKFHEIAMKRSLLQRREKKNVAKYIKIRWEQLKAVKASATRKICDIREFFFWNFYTFQDFQSSYLLQIPN